MIEVTDFTYPAVKKTFDLRIFYLEWTEFKGRSHAKELNKDQSDPFSGSIFKPTLNAVMGIRAGKKFRRKNLA